jgi:hypothetical protein
MSSGVFDETFLDEASAFSLSGYFRLSGSRHSPVATPQKPNGMGVVPAFPIFNAPHEQVVHGFELSVRKSVR